MGHLNRNSHRKLAERLEQYVPGAYVSATLERILEQLVDPEEARLCSLMPLRKVPAEHMARLWGMGTPQAETILETLGSKGVVVEFEASGPTLYALAPPVLGFVEFSMMRVHGELDAKALAELYFQYCQVEGDFIQQQGAANPALSRVFPHEDMLDEVSSEVLSHDRVSEGIDAASCITVGMCYCRHKMDHLGRACDGAMDACLTFNNVARHLSKHGIAREITKDEAHAIVRSCMDQGMVQIGDNTRAGLAVICNCCGCCCDLLLGYRRFGSTGLVSPSAFEARVDAASCTGCGICVDACPVDAITLEADVVAVAEACLGCGVCARFCPSGALRMEARAERPYVPRDFTEKTLLASIDAAKTGNYLFSDQTSRSHAVMRRAVNSALRAPGVRRALRTAPAQRVLIRLLDKAMPPEGR
jgi:NAD-dependent dihydropyrimidine dehydrogenase PreA subunit